MKVIVNNQHINLSFNSSSELIAYFTNLQNQDLVIKNILINQKLIEGGLEEYIINNFKLIKTLEINHIGKNDFTREVETNLNDYLLNAIPQIEKLSESFYLSPSNNDWKDLYDLIEGLHYIATARETYLNDSTSPLNMTSKSYGELLQTIRELAVGIELKDSVVIADILTYEIKNQFEDLQSKLQNFLLIEGEKECAN